MGNSLAIWDEILMPDTLATQEITTAPLSSFVGANICLRDRNVVPAIVEKWRFAVEYQFPSRIRLSGAYVGQHGTDMMVPLPFLKSDTDLECGRSVH